MTETPHKYPFDWVEFHAWKSNQPENVNPRLITWMFEQKVAELLK